jgi:hypothetical protein
MGSRYPTGNGYFIWLLYRTAGGNPVQAAKMAKEAGLSWVTIKVCDGPAAFNFSQRTNKVDLVGPAVKAFRDQGIPVWGWGYTYGFYPEAEASIAAQRVKQFDLDGFFIDAEQEYKQPNKADQARKYMKAIRSYIGNKPIGICAYRFPSLHPEFPWAAFNSCDFNAPQVYWLGAHNSGQQATRSFYEFSNMSGYRNMPFIPIGEAFTEYGYSPNEAEIYDFRNTCAKAGWPGYGWWEWYDATERNSAWWKASTAPMNTPVSELKRKFVLTRYTDLRIRNTASLNGAIVGLMKQNVPVEIVKEQGPWGRIAGTDERWVHLGYCVEVGGLA